VRSLVVMAGRPMERFNRKQVVNVPQPQAPYNFSSESVILLWSRYDADPDDVLSSRGSRSTYG
jgi:hypothetical protein